MSLLSLRGIRKLLEPIETLAHPKVTDYMKMAIDGKIEILHALSMNIPENGIVVEIGSLYGSTAILMGLATEDSVKIHCVELNIRPEFIKYIKEYKMSGKIAIWVGKSQDVGKLWKTPIDLLFIDGNHKYEAVMEDSQTWAPYVKKRGFVAWHDYYNKLHGCQEVGKAIDDFLEEKKEVLEVIMPQTEKVLIRVARKL